MLQNLMWCAAMLVSLFDDEELCINILESGPTTRCSLISPGKFLLKMGFKILFNAFHELVVCHVCRSLSAQFCF